MSTFYEQLERAWTAKNIANSSKFCEISGASKSYVSDLKNLDKLPHLETLRDWLHRAGFDAVTTANLILALSREHARRSTDTAPYIAHIESRIAEAELLAAEALELLRDLEQRGLQLPPLIRHRLRSVG